MKLASKFPASLSREYTIASLLVFLFVLLISVLSIYDTYQFHKKDRFYRYDEEANNLMRVINRDLNYISNLSQFIGNVISQHGDSNDLEFIAEVFRRKFNYSKEQGEFYLWSVFTWANKEGYVLVSNQEGVLKSPNLLPKSRTYIKNAFIHPWRTFVDRPDIGVTSRRYVIPTGMGVTDAKQQFMGIITTGIDVDQLKSRLDASSTASRGFHYLLLTSNYDLVTSSSHSTLNLELLKSRLQTLQLRSSNLPDAGFFKEPLVLGNITYHYYLNNYRHPFILLVGEATHLLQKELSQVIYSHLLNNVLLASTFVILLYFFHRYIVRPMVRLANAALEISQGKTNVIIPQVNSIEAKRMADALHQVQRLVEVEQKLQQELKHANEHLEERVLERTAELNQALKAKSQFINNIGHEIRKPIHNTFNYLEFVIHERNRLDAAKREEYLFKAYKSSEGLFSLVDTLLDLSIFQSGKTNCSMSQQRFEVIVEQALEEFPSLNSLHNKPLFLNHEKPTSSTKVYCDPLEIQKVIRNLLLNAIKYTAEGELTARIFPHPVHYSDGTQKSGIAFSLEDEGVGIPEEELELIFQPFNQSKRTYKGTGGSGLGLSLAAEIIEAHKGRIWAKNNSDKAGSTFIFVLPILK